MAKQELNSKTAKKLLKEQQDNSGMTITDILGLCISNWKWFAVCLALTLSFAALYLRVTPPIFIRSTSIVVKEDANSEALDDIFSKIKTSKTQSSTSLTNEMIALGKASLMTKVVSRLNLDFQYEIRGKLRNTVLYGSSLPITVEIVGKNDGLHAVFRIHINNDNTVTFKNGIAGGGEGIKGMLNQPMRTPIGTIIVHPASFAARTNDDITVTRMSYSDATQMFLGKLSVTNTNEESSVIDLSLHDVNIQRADDVLNTLIAVYNEQWIENRNQVIVATNKFIGERLDALERELGDVENEMTSYQINNHTLDFDEEGGRFMGRSYEYENQGISFENELALTKFFRDYVAKIHDYNQTLPLSSGINNTSLQQQVGEYNGLILSRSNLISSSTENNPLVTDVNKQIDVLRHGILITVDNHMNTLKTQVQMLAQNNEKNNEEIDKTPNKHKLYVDIERRRKIKEQLYTYLLQTREQNELNQAFAAYNTRVLEPSGGSSNQAFPDVKKVWMIAFAIGFGLPFAFILLRELTNSKIRGRKDIEKLQLPFVGELPLMEFADEKKGSLAKLVYDKICEKMKEIRKGKKHKKRKDKARVVVKQGSRNVINEAFRVLRTNLEFMIGQNRDMKVIMTTSANPGSGKTFISYNLALCMSLKGKKVCAIDLDLRRRSLSEYVNKPERGVSDYINGSVSDWHDVLIQSPESETFHILPVGTLPPNPAEIISYDEFAQLIIDIRKEYDYVFFDCPPVEIVADTSILAKYADITVFVIRVGLMEKEFLPVIEEYYNDHRYNNMGIILNGTLTANSRYGYRRYGYRYGYGYGYGYGGYGYYGSGYASGYSGGYSSGADE